MAIIYNELNVAQGLGERQKVFRMKASEAITYGMLCETATESIGGDTVITIKKGYAGTGVAYIAQNSYTNEDATIYDGTAAGMTYITAIPVASNCEVEIPLALITGGTAPAHNTRLVAGSSGLWSAYTSGAATILGTITDVGPEGGVMVLLEKTVLAS